jgi:hypothetical protein
MNPYIQLGNRLKQKGIGAYLQNNEMLVIANQTPAFPNTNCFWVASKDNQWYIGTFFPTVYGVPSTVEIAGVCETVFRSSPTAIYTIDENLTARFGLRSLSDAEVEHLGLA